MPCIGKVSDGYYYGVILAKAFQEIAVEMVDVLRLEAFVKMTRSIISRIVRWFQSNRAQQAKPEDEVVDCLSRLCYFRSK